MRGIRVYVEGGGDSRATKAEIRRGFGGFLRSLREAARQRRLRWDVIACGSRGPALAAFRRACDDHPDAFNVLLVDSESPVGASPTEHLRRADNWRIDQPDEHCHLMVQTMEAWIIADVETLRAFYGQGFQDSAICSTQNVEQIDKAALVPALTKASRRTQKGGYHKIHHAGRLLGLLDAAVVRSKARHCERLFATLTKVIAESR